jgi:hypothetical protein
MFSPSLCTSGKVVKMSVPTGSIPFPLDFCRTSHLTYNIFRLTTRPPEELEWLRLALPHGPNRVCLPFNLATQIDPVSEALCSEPLTIKDDQNPNNSERCQHHKLSESSIPEVAGSHPAMQDQELRCQQENVCRGPNAIRQVCLIAIKIQCTHRLKCV